VGSVKALRVVPIASTDARRIIRALHYSGKVAANSQVHLGIFLDGRCGGAIQFGPPMDKRRLQGLVGGTAWHEFLELNRLALADWMPRNSESRALGYALRFLHRTYPWLKWIVSFADATQCGDGAIYRATGFLLTGIKKNRTILRLADGRIVADKTLNEPNYTGARGQLGSSQAREDGAVPLPGFQLRYIYFLDPASRAQLTAPVLPFSTIARLGAGMYKGQVRDRSREIAATPPSVEGGEIPTRSLQ
jgi:hypothetical protein